MRLVSLASYPPNQRAQVNWCTIDALGSSNMMLSGLILVTRNRFVQALHSVHSYKANGQFRC